MNIHLGKQIKIARITKGITQQDLADKINKTRPLISSSEQTGRVNIYTLKQICQVLDMDFKKVSNSTQIDILVNKDEDRIEKLTADIATLKRENKMLLELVETQKETIQLLKGRK